MTTEELAKKAEELEKKVLILEKELKALRGIVFRGMKKKKNE